MKWRRVPKALKVCLWLKMEDWNVCKESSKGTKVKGEASCNKLNMFNHSDPDKKL